MKQDWFARLREAVYPYRTYFLAFVCALMVDTISTIHFMCATGPEDELHPIVRLAAFKWGPITGPIVAAMYKLIAALIIMRLCRPLIRPALMISTIVYLFAGVYNYFAVEMYASGLIGWLPF